MTRKTSIAVAICAACLLLRCAGTAVAGQMRRPPVMPSPPQPTLPQLAPLPPLPPVPPLSVHILPPFDVDPLDVDLESIGESAREAVLQSLQALGALHESAGVSVLESLQDGFAFRFSEQRPPRDRTEARADALYRSAREAIDRGRYETAIQQLDRLINLADTSRVDAALYWKSYTQAKLGQRAEALTTLADLQNRFGSSRWLKDAKALEVEIRQASGQAVSPDSQNDEELKLLALRGLMQSDPDRAVPMIERLLDGNSSVKVQENALFVLSQSQSARAREIIAKTAKGAVNPDVQLRAIRYLGAIGGPEERQVLDEVYRGSTDAALKRAILRAFMTGGDRTRLLALAKSETSPELRAQAVQQLGVLHATTELADLYRNEPSAEMKKRILQAMVVGGDADRLIELAKSEKDVELRRAAIQNLGLMAAGRTGEALKQLYLSDASADIRREVINALFVQQNAGALVEAARAEKDPAMKKEIVSKLSLLRSKEASDYLLELLK